MFKNTIENLNLFNINNLNKNDKNENKALVLSGCRLSILKNIKYSELDENNYFYLNNNDYGCEGINIELNFDNNYENPYFEFFLNCITIKIDNELLVKANIKLNDKKSAYTKINENGKLSIGMGYFFKSEEEYEIIRKCSSFIFEGFIALNKKENVFGFMCEVEKNKDSWHLLKGNTYKIFKNIKIDELKH